MSKNFRCFAFSFLILLLIAGESSAVTKYEFLNNILLIRGIDWSESPEAPYNDAAGFLLRTGYVPENVGKLNADVTRREALRWCVECLGMTFEAGLLTDYPTGFKDEKILNEFERGCLVVATHMNPPLFSLSSFKGEKFSGNTKLSIDEARAIIQRLSGASRNFRLDVIRNPVKGLRVHIHREGVPTGIPTWRFFADGIKTRAAADYFKSSLTEEGYEAGVLSVNGLYTVRVQKIEDYNQVRYLESIARARGLT